MRSTFFNFLMSTDHKTDVFFLNPSQVKYVYFAILTSKNCLKMRIFTTNVTNFQFLTKI